MSLVNRCRELRFATVALLTIALVQILSDRANGAELSAAYQHCNDKAVSNPDFEQCGGDEINRQDKRLNLAWKKALACFDHADGTSRDAQRSLLEEQRLWIKWKDAACGFYYPHSQNAGPVGFAGREGEVIHFGYCKANILAERATFFEAFAKECR
jgi:uncharacterized protein YecT (DUF1311 family)